MAYTAKLRRVRGSVIVTLPPALLAKASLMAGQEVILSIEGGRLVIEPRQRRRYTLAELLAQCDPRRHRSANGRDWLEAPAVGHELM